MGETNSEVIEIIPGREESVWDHPYTWSEVKSLSCVRLFATPWAVAYQDPQSMGFSRQEYWSGLPFPSILMCGIVSKVIDMEKSGDILDLFWKYSKKVLLMGWLWVWGREGGHMECQGFWLNQLEGNSCELRQGFRVAGWREDPEFGCGNLYPRSLLKQVKGQRRQIYEFGILQQDWGWRLTLGGAGPQWRDGI